jgi:hypothetical protein
MRPRPALRRLHEDLNTQSTVDPAGEGSEAVRKLNAQVRRIIDCLPHRDKHTLLDFLCECGCCEPVRLTLSGYDAHARTGRPVYLTGHPAGDTPIG